jgi:MGT family glycosyltransferase
VAVIAFFNIGMHGRVNPTLPVVAELVRRGHAVRYYTTPAFAKELSDVGADVVEYEDGGAIPDPPTPLALLEVLARSTLAVLPVVLPDLRSARPDLVVHDAACPWGAVAARQLAVPAAA